MLDSAQQRANAVATQLRTNDVKDPRLIRAILSVPREDFVPAPLKALAYVEGVIPLGMGRVLLDLRSFGKMAQLAAIGASDRVLDIGCTTGYSTAVFSHLAAQVFGVEQNPKLAEAATEGLRRFSNAEIVCAELNDGLKAEAPFDVIFLNGAVTRVPGQLIEQLKHRGRLVCVVRDGEAGHARVYVKNDEAIGERSAFDAQLPLLPGFEDRPSFAF